MGIASIPAIAILCAFAGKSLKEFKKFPSQHIPFTCSVIGAFLGFICFYTMPGYILAANWLDAVVIGIVSGGFSTTSHQMGKQNSAAYKTYKGGKNETC